MKNKITFDELLEMFRIGFGVDETVFYFDDDKEQQEHYIGYIPKYDKPYWAGYCDISAEENTWLKSPPAIT